MFNAAGPATEKALFPNSVIVRGTSYVPDVEDRNAARHGSTETGTRALEMYSGQKPFTTACVSRQRSRTHANFIHDLTFAVACYNVYRFPYRNKLNTDTGSRT